MWRKAQQLWNEMMAYILSSHTHKVHRLRNSKHKTKITSVQTWLQCATSIVLIQCKMLGCTLLGILGRIGIPEQMTIPRRHSTMQQSNNADATPNWNLFLNLVVHETSVLCNNNTKPGYHPCSANPTYCTADPSTFQSHCYDDWDAKYPLIHTLGWGLCGFTSKM